MSASSAPSTRSQAPLRFFDTIYECMIYAKTLTTTLPSSVSLGDRMRAPPDRLSKFQALAMCAWTGSSYQELAAGGTGSQAMIFGIALETFRNQ